MTSIAQLPIVLYDGTILTGRGINRRYGIVFRVPAKLEALLPTSEACTDAAVAQAMRFLTDEWLCDVATDYQGKCIIIACALTILERALLPRAAGFLHHSRTARRRQDHNNPYDLNGRARPTSRRGRLVAQTRSGERHCSPISDRSSAAGLGQHPPGLCRLLPVDRKVLTTRALQRPRSRREPDIKTVRPYTVQIFTGNNIAPRGDLASRALTVRLAVDRIDPENRTFRHPDPIEWTTDHRGRSSRRSTHAAREPAPRQKKSEQSPAPTRFKAWWDMVGSAVEFAAQQHVALVKEEAERFAGDPPDAAPPTTVDFNTLFLDGEEDEEQACSLASVLDVLTRKWPDGAMFQAGNVVKSIFQSSGNASYAASIAEGEAEAAASFKAALELATGKVVPLVSAPVINWRLQALKDTPAIVDGKALVLRYTKPNRNGRDGGFRVVTLKIDDIGQAAM